LALMLTNITVAFYYSFNFIYHTAPSNAPLIIALYSASPALNAFAIAPLRGGLGLFTVPNSFKWISLYLPCGPFQCIFTVLAPLIHIGSDIDVSWTVQPFA